MNASSHPAGRRSGLRRSYLLSVEEKKTVLSALTNQDPRPAAKAARGKPW